MSTLSKIKFNNSSPYFMPPKIYKGDELIYNVSDGLKFDSQYLTLESLEDNNTISFTRGLSENLNAPKNTYYVSTDMKNWSEYDDTMSWTINNGDKLYFKSLSSTWARTGGFGAGSIIVYWRFSSTKMFKAYGNIASIVEGGNFNKLNYDTYSGQYNIQNNALHGLFNGCNLLTNVKDLILPYRALPVSYIYDFLFYNCTMIEEAPYLDWRGGYFNPNFQYMFYGCSNLRYIKCNFVQISPTSPVSCTNWVDGVAANGVFVKNANVPISTPDEPYGWVRGKNGIPNGWTVLDI